MPHVFGRKPLALKHVSKMPLASGAKYFDAAHAKGVVRLTHNGPGDLIVERRPSATAIKLVRRAIQRRVATATDIQADAFVIPILAGKSALGPFVCDHVFFFRRELIPLWIVHWRLRLRVAEEGRKEEAGPEAW